MAIPHLPKNLRHRQSKTLYYGGLKHLCTAVDPVFILPVYPQAQRHLPGFGIDNPIFRNATGRIFGVFVAVVAFPIGLAWADHLYHQDKGGISRVIVARVVPAMAAFEASVCTSRSGIRQVARRPVTSISVSL